MVDYLAWSKADPLTAEQAARLWAEVDPSTPRYALTPVQSAAIAARLQMLSGKITVGELQADIRANGLAFIGRHESSLISRASLRDLAVKLGERPRFLFNVPVEEFSGTAPPIQEGVAANDHNVAASAAGSSDPKGDWYSRVSAEINAAPNASLRSIRVVPGARRSSSAPPPPPYVRGISGPLPARAPATASADTSPLFPAANHRRAAGRKPNQREEVSRWIAKKYPTGVPTNITTDAIVAELKGDGITVSPRTVSRAMGRK